MKEHKYIRRTQKYYGGLIFIIASLILIFFYINTRPVVYIQDEITGKKEMFWQWG